MINVLEMLEASAYRFAESIVVVDEKKKITYSQLLQYSKQIGSCIAKEEYRNKAIAVLLPKSADMLCCFMGIIYSGNFYVPIDSEMPIDRMNKIFQTILPQKIIVSEETALLDLQEYNKCKILFEDLIKAEVDYKKLQEVRRTAIDTDPVYALFTSGSTGVPKGVVVCHRSVIDYAKWCRDTFEFDNETIFGNQTPFYFSMSVLDIYSTLISGGSLVIIPKIFFSFPADLVEYLNKHKVNTIYWVPSALCIVANSNILSVLHVKYINKVLFAGEVMPTKQLNIWKKYVPSALYANLFGPTEITDIGIYYILDREFEDHEPIPIGNTCVNVDAFILDEDNKLVTSENQIGELYFRGSYLAHGYYRNWDKTKEVFVQNPLNQDYPEIVYKTGDLVRLNEYGEMVYVSRKDFQIKHMGYRIELGEIENCANAVPMVDRTAIIFDKEKDDIVMFYEGKNTEDGILEFMGNKLPRYMIPNKVFKMKRLPLNENGKIDKKKLQER